MSSSETSSQGIVPEATPSDSTVAPWDKSAHATSEPLGNATPQPTQPTQPTQPKPDPQDSAPEPAEETKLTEGIGSTSTQDVTAEGVIAVPAPLTAPVSVSSSVVVLSDSLRWEVLSQVASSSAVGLRLLGEYSLVRRLKFVDILYLVALVAVGLPVMSLFMGSPFAQVILVCAIVSLFMAGVNNHLAVKYSRRFRSVVFDKVPQGKLSKSDVAYLIIGYLMLAVFTTLHIMTISSWGGNLEALYESYRYLEGSIEFISYMLIVAVFILNFLLFIYLSFRYISRSLSSDYAEFADYLNNEWTLGNAIALTVKE